MKRWFRSVRAASGVGFALSLQLASSTVWAASTDPSGDLDATFGPSGKPEFNVATVTVPSFSRALIALPGGGVIIGGGSNSNGFYKDYVIQKLNANGQFDGAFGTDAGFTHTDMGADDQINAMAVNSTGTRICGGGIAGPTATTSASFGVACYTSNGLLDPSFSAGGADGDGIDKSNPPGVTVSRIEGMVFDRDDKLIVVGWSNNPAPRDWIIRRFNTDGTPDTNFGTNSWVVLDWGGFDRCFDVAILKGATHAQDKIVVVGSSQNNAGGIAILNSTGALDTTTGLVPTGKFTGTPGNLTQFRSVAIEQATATKFLVVTGQASPTGVGFLVARYPLAGGAAIVSPNFGSSTNDVGWRVRVATDASNVDRVYASGTINAGGNGDFRVVKMKADLTQVAASPELDYSATTDFGGSSDFAQDLVIVNSGDVNNERVFASGGGSNGLNSMTVAKYLPNGAPDTSFNGTGKYEAQLTGGSADESVAFAVQADGKAVVAGTTFNSSGDYDLAVTRVNTDGTRDTANWAAGTGGWYTHGFAAGSAEQLYPGGVAIDGNGKAVVVGTSNGYFVERFTVAGVPDVSFDTDGIVLGNWGANSEGKVVAIDASNNVIIGGDISLNGDFKFSRLAASNGAVDAAFGTSGTATVDISAGKSDSLKAIAIDPSGKIVAAGECFNASSFGKMCLARLNSNGSLDTSFNTTGKVFLSNLSGNDTFDIRSLQLLPNLDTPSATDYKIVVAGQYVQSSPSQAMWLAARFNMDGSLDTSFNSTGYKTFAAGASTYIGSANSVAMQYDEKLVIVGESSAPDPLNAGFFLNRVITVARLNWDGSLDTTYGTNGFTYTSFSSDPSEAHQAYVYPQSNATLKGEALLTPFIIASDFAMNRYLADPAVTNPSTPVMLASDDSGRINSDAYTKVTSPHFTGTCGQGDTVYILVGGAQTQPRSRGICSAAGTYNVQIAVPFVGNPATQYSITARSQNGVGDSSASAALSATIDTVVVPPVISSVLPAAGVSGVLPHPTISGTSEGQADVVVANNAPGNGCASPNYATNAGNWTCNSTFEQGLHSNVSVVQTDLAGNVSAAATTTFRVKIPTTTTIAHNVASPPSVYGQSVTFTANVAATGGYAVQTDFAGTAIHIQIDGVDAATPSVSAAGVATFSTSTLNAGTHSIKAIYDENNNWVGSTSSTITLVVIPANTTTAVASSLNPSVYGQPVTFTATVTDSSAGSIAVPTGAVQFVVDGVNFGSPVALAGATTTTSTATSGAIATLNVAGSPHSVTANYVNADGNFNNSNGTLSGGQVVNPAATSTAVVSSLNPSTIGQSVHFTATVTDTASTAVPTGTVQFVVDGTNFGSPVALTGATSNSSTAQSQATTTLTVAGSPHTVTANYVHADANFNNSSGALSGGQTVLKITTTTAIGASPGTITLGDTVTLTATVTAASSTAQGIVTFFDGSVPIGSTALNGVVGNDQAVMTTSLLSAAGSPHSITAIYQGNASFAVSASSATPETVNRRTSTTGVVMNPTAVVVTQPSTATVTVTDSGSVPPGTADAFAATGAPATGRTGFAATLFGDGLVLVAGGTDANNNVLNSAEIYSASGAAFGATGNLGAARTGAAAVLLPNGQVLIAGGSSDGTATGALNTAELFDPSTGTFMATSHTLNAARVGATAVLLNTGKVLLAGGANSGGVLNSAELYDAATDTFTATGNLNAARSGASAKLLANGKVLVAGGSSDGTANGALNSAEVFNPAAAGTFAAVAGANPTLSATRWQPETARLLSGKVLVAGGMDAGGALTSADLYDPIADSFTATGEQMSQARAGGTAVALPSGMVLLAGGTTSQAVDLYDGDSDQFNTTGSLQQSDSGLQSILLNNGQVLVVGLVATPASDAELYSPSFNPLGSVAVTSSEPTDVIGTCMLSPSTSTASTCAATVTPANVATSPHTITGTYPADTVHLGSSNTASLTLNKTDTSTTVTSSANPSAFGQSVTLTATVAPTTGSGTPTGTVTFLDGGSTIGSGTLSGGVATFATSALAAGAHTITTHYAGDGNFNANDGSLTGNPQVVNNADSTTNVASSANPSVFGQSITFTATLSAVAPGSGTPTGSVTFLDGGTPIGSGTLSGGIATFTTSTLLVGDHTITTQYGGDANFNGSAGSLTTNPQVVNKADTATAVTSSQNPSAFGQSVTFTASVSAVAPGGGAATGTVTFLDGGNPIGSGPLSGGVATLTTSTLATGTHTITTSYGGDANFNGSSGSLSGNPQVVNAANSTTTVASSGNPAVYGQSVTFTATVTDSSGGSTAVPTGAVQFVVDGVNFGSPVSLAGASANSSAASSSATTTLSVTGSPHSVSANYVNADGNFNNSSGSLAGGQSITVAGTSTAVTSSSNPSVFGESVTFTATVTDNATAAAPTGSVQFIVDGVNFGSPVSLTGASANSSTATSSATTTLSIAGSPHSVSANYVNADGNFSNSSGPLSQVVGKAASAAVTQVTPPGPITAGGSVQLTATVGAAPPGAGTPTGTVTFLDGANTIGSAPLTGGTASMTTSALTAGNHSFTSSYSGDSNFNSTTSPAAVLSVTPATRTITATAGANGSISPSTQYVVDGNTASFTVTPQNGFTAMMSTTCPEGLGTLDNDIYTSLAISQDCSVTATFVSASTTLTLTLTDNRSFVHYNGFIDYVVTLSNSSGSDATGLTISGVETSPSSNLDTAVGHWQCFGTATECLPTGTGPFLDGNVTVPANTTLAWIVSIPKRPNPPDGFAAYEVTVSGITPVLTQSDTDFFVIFRDGFNVPNGDGTGTSAPNATSAMNWDGSPLTLSPTTTASGVITTVLEAKAADHSGFRVDEFKNAGQDWLRAVTFTPSGQEQPSNWVRVQPTASLGLSVACAQDNCELILVGGDAEVDVPIAASTSWQVHVENPSQ